MLDRKPAELPETVSDEWRNEELERAEAEQQASVNAKPISRRNPVSTA
jgi:hypothetical protein